MSKIYIVTRGCYSDYSINGAFSTREKAERWIAECRCGDYSKIEEYDLDQGLSEMERGLHLFGIEIRKNGDIIAVTEGGFPSIVGPIESWSTYGGLGPAQIARQTVWVWANDKDHAIKIANEHRIAALCNNVPTYGPLPDTRT